MILCYKPPNTALSNPPSQPTPTGERRPQYQISESSYILIRWHLSLELARGVDIQTHAGSNSKSEEHVGAYAKYIPTVCMLCFIANLNINSFNETTCLASKCNINACYICRRGPNFLISLTLF